MILWDGGPAPLQKTISWRLLPGAGQTQLTIRREGSHGRSTTTSFLEPGGQITPSG